MGSSMKCGATSLCGNYVGGSISRMTRHGLPAAKTFSGTSRVTTLPAIRAGSFGRSSARRNFRTTKWRRTSLKSAWRLLTLSALLP